MLKDEPLDVDGGSVNLSSLYTSPFGYRNCQGLERTLALRWSNQIDSTSVIQGIPVIQNQEGKEISAHTKIDSEGEGYNSIGKRSR
jgi:hypothetical protein